MQKGRTNQVAVNVRFAVKPPSKFRSTLRETWNLTWNGAQRCWHGTVENADARDEIAPARDPARRSDRSGLTETLVNHLSTLMAHQVYEPRRPCG